MTDTTFDFLIILLKSLHRSSQILLINNQFKEKGAKKISKKKRKKIEGWGPGEPSITISNIFHASVLLYAIANQGHRFLSLFINQPLITIFAFFFKPSNSNTIAITFPEPAIAFSTAFI